MAKNKKRIASLAVATVMTASCASGLIALTGCAKNKDTSVTYNTYTAVLPSNWNELTYQDNNDTQIMSYIGGSFFENDYVFDAALGGKFKADGTVNRAAVVEGAYSTEYSAVTKIKDVTSEVDSKWGYTEKQKQTGGYAWEFTLRQDLKWDDGSAIKAEDFIYTMKEQLSPDFFNYRASSYYDSVPVINAKNYLYSTTAVTYQLIGDYYESNAAAIAANEEIYVNSYEFYNAKGALKLTSYTDYTYVCENVEIPEWVKGSDTTLYLDPAIFDYAKVDENGEIVKDANGNIVLDQEMMEHWETTVEDFVFSGEFLFQYIMAVYPAYVEVGGPYESWLALYKDNPYLNLKFEDVGIYVKDEYTFVLCTENAFNFIDKDNNLTYECTYYLGSLPLVKKDLYESCKKQPSSGSTLWTSNYNSSLETTASWGPYKLTSFQSGKSYTLEKNEYWYGWNMETNANQYNVDKIYCEEISDISTAWMGFFNGTIDTIGIDVTHAEDYRNSKYATTTPGSYTFCMHLGSGENNDRNNGILQIPEFRKAISLGTDRVDYATTTTTAYLPAYGLLNNSYYYDIANSTELDDDGIYRNTAAAKSALLRAYGYTFDGTAWSDGKKTYQTLDAAYAALTGFDLDAARELVKTAHAELVANAGKYGYNSSKNITIKFGTSADTESSRRECDYIQKIFDDITKTTPLEGKVKVVFDASFGAKWFDSFAAGEYDVCTGAWGGAVFNPVYLMQVYIDANTAYTPYWDTRSETITWTLPGNAGDFDYAGEELTLSVYNWWAQLYRGAWAHIDDEYKMQILAMLEEYVLGKYYSIPIMSQNSASMLGAKFSSFSSDYNVFLGRGGIRYMIVNYNNGDWADFVASQGGDLANFYKAEAED